jgi:hypothetical protein
MTPLQLPISLGNVRIAKNIIAEPKELIKIIHAR